MKACLSVDDAVEIFYVLADGAPLQAKVGIDGAALVSPNPPEFTPEEALEIARELRAKAADIKSGFYGREGSRKWRAHLLAILEEIGEHGERLLPDAA